MDRAPNTGSPRRTSTPRPHVGKPARKKPDNVPSLDLSTTQSSVSVKRPLTDRSMQSPRHEGRRPNTTPRPIVGGTLLYSRKTAVAGRTEVETSNVINVKLNEISGKRGVERANAILDLGRNVILVEGTTLSKQDFDGIVNLIFEGLRDPSWEVAMDSLWLLDVLRQENHLNQNKFDEIKREVSQGLGNNNNNNVNTNAQKLYHNLGLYGPSGSFERTSAPEPPRQADQRIIEENAALRDQLQNALKQIEVQNQQIENLRNEGEEIFNRQGKQIDEQRRENDELRNAYGELTNDNKEKEAKISSLSKQIEQYSGRNAELDRGNAQNQQMINDLQKQVQAAESERENLSGRLKAANQQNEGLIAERENQNIAHKEALEAKDKQIAQDTAKNVLLSKQLAEKDAVIQKSQKENLEKTRNQGREIKELQSENSKLKKDALKWEEENADIAAELEQLQNEANKKESELNARVKTLEAQVKDGQADLSGALEDLLLIEDKTAENERLMALNEELLAELERNQQIAKADEFHFETIRTQGARIEVLKDEKAKLDRHLKEVDKNLKQEKDKTLKLQKDLEKTQQEKNKAKRENEDFKLKYRQQGVLIRNAKKTSAELEALKVTVKDLRKKESKNEIELSKLRAEKARLEQEALTADDKNPVIIDLRKSLEKLQTESTETIKDRESKLRSEVSKNRDLTNDKQKLEEQVSALDSENTSMGKEIESLKETNEQHVTTINQFTSKLSNKTSELTTAKERHEEQVTSLRAQMEALVAENKTLKSKEEPAARAKKALEEENQQLKTQLRDLTKTKQSLEEAKQQVIAEQKKSAELAQSNQTLNTKLTNANQTSQAALTDLQAQLTTEKETAAKAKAALESEKQASQTEVANREHQIAQLTSKFNAQQSEIEMLNATLSELRNQIQNAGITNTTLQERYNKAFKDYESWVDHAKTLEAQLATGASTNQNLQNQLTEITGLNKSLQDQVIGLDGEIAKLQAQLADKAAAEQAAARKAAEKIASDKLATEKAARQAEAEKIRAEKAAVAAAEEAARRTAAEEAAKAEAAAKKSAAEKLPIDKALEKASELSSSLVKSLPQIKSELLAHIQAQANSTSSSSPEIARVAEALSKISVQDLPLSKITPLAKDLNQVQTEAERFAEQETRSQWTTGNESNAGRAFNEAIKSYIQEKTPELNASQAHYRDIIRSSGWNVILDTAWNHLNLAEENIRGANNTIEAENKQWVKVKTFNNTLFTGVLNKAMEAVKQLTDVQKIIQGDALNSAKEQAEELVRTIESHR